MNIKKTAVLAALVVASAPLASEAGPGPSAAVNACVKAFTETYLPDRVVRTVKKDVGAIGAIEAYYQPRRYTVALAAYGASSGDLIAQARCVANHTGVVVVLDSPPAGEYVARADFAVALR